MINRSIKESYSKLQKGLSRIEALNDVTENLIERLRISPYLNEISGDGRVYIVDR